LILSLISSLKKINLLRSQCFEEADTAVVITRGDVHKGRPGRLRKIQTYTVIRQETGDWKVAAFQNTKHKALMEAISFKARPATKPAAV
jgi:hypothetical protein